MTERRLRLPNCSYLSWGISLVVIAVFCGCDGPPETPATGLQIRTAALESCPDNPNLDGEFPDNASSVVLQLTGGALERPLTASFTTLEDGAAVLSDVPVGQGMSLQVVACTAGGEVNWAGAASGIDVDAIGAQIDVPIMLTPSQGVARVGTCLDVGTSTVQPTEGRAFAALTTVLSGGALVAGGFSTLTTATRELKATATVDLYESASSRFVPSLALDEPRAMARATTREDGTVRIIGGVRSARIGLTQPFDVSAQDAPQHGVLDYSVAAGVTPWSGVSLPALPAVASHPSGALLAVGGIAEGDVPSATALYVPPDATRGSGEELALSLPSPRFGSAVAFDDSGSAALVWGGGDDGAESPLALWMDLNDGSVASLTFEDGGGTLPGQVLFASAHHLGGRDGQVQFAVLGGVGLGLRDVQEARAWTVSVNPDALTVEARPLAGVEAWASDLRRAAATLRALEDGRLWLLGGYQSFSQGTQADPCGESAVCFPTQSLALRIDPGTSAVSEVEARSLAPKGLWQLGPLGATGTRLVDGSWLITSGLVGLAGGPVSRDAGLVRYAVPDSAICNEPIGRRTTR